MNRPAHIPSDAIFNEAENEWQLGVRGDNGEPTGLWKYWWAPTGHLCSEANHVDANNFTYTRYHNDGTYSAKGTYKNGAPDGLVQYQKSENETMELALTEPLYARVFRVSCVIKGGQGTEWRYFDKNDTRVDLDGRPVLTQAAFADNFSGRVVPEALVKLVDYQADNGRANYAAGFALVRDDKSLLTTFSSDPTFLSALVPFATANDSGSSYALWSKSADETPVIVIGDEGGLFVIANDVVDLLRLLSADHAPSVWPDEVAFNPELYEPSATSAPFRKWLKATFGITAVKDPSKVVKAAQKNHQAAFAAWLTQFARSS